MMAHGQLRYGEYARRQKGARSVTGMAIVIALHVALVYLVVTGLGRSAINVVKGPLETKVIDLHSAARNLHSDADPIERQCDHRRDA